MFVWVSKFKPSPQPLSQNMPSYPPGAINEFIESPKQLSTTLKYTILQNKYPYKLYIIGKVIYRRVRINLHIGQIFLFRDFINDFREMVKIGPFWKLEKMSNS